VRREGLVHLCFNRNPDREVAMVCRCIDAAIVRRATAPPPSLVVRFTRPPRGAQLVLVDVTC